MAAHPALAVKEVVRFPLVPLDRWGLPPIPLNTGRDLPSIRPSKVAACTATGVCGACVSFLGPAGVKRTRPPPYPPVPVVARVAVGGGGSNDAH